jgi:serine/threonine protein kinase
MGAFGDTWRAGDTAIKIICSENYPTERLDREVEGLRRVNSPNVVTLLETLSLHLGGAIRPAMRFEFIDGGDISGRVNLMQWPDVAEAEHLLRGLLSGVQALHKANTIHRDIKPENIALRDGSWGSPVLLDLGLAKQIDRSTITVYPGHIGTAAYMAPEQLRGEPARKTADLWAIGVTVRQLLCHRHPFYGDGESFTIEQALKKLSEGPLPLPHDVKEPLRTVLDRLTSVQEYERGSAGSNLRRLDQ